MEKLNLFKFEYSWYEGEFRSIILATEKDKDEIEKDLKQAVKKSKIKKDSLDCKPNRYNAIIEFLIKKGYILSSFIENDIYELEEDCYSNKRRRYWIENKEIRKSRRII